MLPLANIFTNALRAYGALLFDLRKKRCITCKLVKARSEFRPYNGSRDGLRRTCRECLTTGRYRPYIEPPHLRAKRKARQSKPRWRASHRRAIDRYSERYPIASQAARTVVAAVKAGKIDKAKTCQALGCRSPSSEAHHWSYSPEHWLSVLWLCAAHHRQGHAQGWIVPKPHLPSYMGAIPERPDSPHNTITPSPTGQESMRAAT